MDPITIRISEDLTEEATSEGFASRAAYIRYLLQRHPERSRSDTGPNTSRNRTDTESSTQRMRSDIESNTDRLDRLEARIDALEVGSHAHDAHAFK